MVMNPAQLPALVDIAIRTAYARRGVAHLTVPNDIQVAPAGAGPVPDRRAGPAAGDRADVPGARRYGPRDADLRRAAEVLNAGGKVAILAGIGARGAGRAGRAGRRRARRAGGQVAARARWCCRTTRRTPPAASGCSAPRPARS